MITKTKWTLSLLSALATALIMQTQGAGLKTDFTPLGIVSLELASNLAQVQHILALWNHEALVLNIGLDFLFIPAYTFFFIQSLQITLAKHSLSWLQQLGKKLLVVAYVAAVLDIVENILMIGSCLGHYSATSICATASIASAKFVGIGFILLYLIASPIITYTRKTAN